MQDALQRFTPASARAVRQAVADADGNEVFILGRVAAGKVAETRVLARGNRHAAPAILHVPRAGEVVIHNHPSGHLTPSDQDLDIASTLGNDGVGFYIVDSDVDHVYVVVEPHAAAQPVALDAHELAAHLAPDGLVASALPDYERRPQQLEMLAAVTSAFNDATVLTVEAGTGTGKSLAYLVPAILWSRANQQRVIVSTHTINLQEQLVGKDLPMLVDRPGLECRVALVKGRGNYLCKRKAAQVEAQGALLIEDERAAELRQILAWAKRTTDGSLADLTTRPHPEVWDQVVSENDNCLRTRCPYYSVCFFYNARRAAAAADVLVVNHHLLMADVALREDLGSYTQNAVLPPALCVIIDEAHHLEDAATSHFGVRVSFRMIERVLSRLRAARNEAKGVLPALLFALESIEGPDDAALAHGAAHWIEERLLPARASLLQDTEECFARLLALDDTEQALAPERDKLRITARVRETGYWRQMVELLEGLARRLIDYAAAIDHVLERTRSLSDKVDKQVIFLATELNALQGRLGALAEALYAFVTEDDDLCRWIERPRPGTMASSLSFHSAPIEVAPRLRKALFEPFQTAVLTSATLTVDRRFDFLHQRLGIAGLEPEERVQTLRVESPFEFSRQALLAVADDLPDPNTPAFEPATHDALRRLLTLAQGGTFVLCTSYGALERAYHALAAELERSGLTALRQGEASRHSLLARFTRTPGAVLFATDSFWEGVDVKGDALHCVVIPRLPFRVPTDPIEEARVEAIAARGGDPFVEHTVPQAVIKLKQGFGRLIRSRTDRGCVVILDSRVVRKRYGRIFLTSLPPARRLIGESEEVYRGVGEFFARRL